MECTFPAQEFTHLGFPGYFRVQATTEERA